MISELVFTVHTRAGKQGLAAAHIYALHLARGRATTTTCLEVMHRDGLTFTEVPIDFLDRTGGTSKIPRSQIFVSANALLRLGLARRQQAKKRGLNL